MALIRWVALGLVWIVAVATAVRAEDLEDVSERIFEISPFAGTFRPDPNIRYEATSALLGLRAGINNSPYWGLEAQFSYASGQRQQVTRGVLTSYRWQPAFDANNNFTGFVISDLVTEEEKTSVPANLVMFGGSAIVNISKKRFRPFLTAGLGFIEDISNTKENPPSPFSNFYGELGFGFKLLRKSGWTWRLDVRDLIMRRDDLPRPDSRAAILAAQTDLSTGGGADGIIGREPYDPTEYRATRWLHNFVFGVSISIPYGYVWKDGDGDQIEDRFDSCLTTAPGVVVDQIGCGVDSDQDGVYDGLDECADTPLGATVNLVGCPSDVDNDGVLDGLDECPSTLAGATVDLVGCPSDTDSDGVLDGLDACDDTPLGAAIDEKGCAIDPMERMLLKGETIMVTGVEFEPGTDELEPTSYHNLNQSARLIERWTGDEDMPLRVEIGVHTDGLGSAQHNLDLSRQRARTIRLYILENFFGTGANNLVAVGYGETRPIADDATSQGRLSNRRLEIRKISDGDFPELYDFGESSADDDDELLAPANTEVPATEDEESAPEEIERSEIDDDNE